MSWGRGFGSARFNHFFQNRCEHLGLLKVNVVACTGNSPARDRVVGICAKVGKDLAVLRIKPPRQIANWDTAPRKLAKRTNRLAPQRHLVGTRLLERERERFRVVGKTARPKSFPLVGRKILLAFEQGQARPPAHESGHSFAPHARGPREVALAKRPSRGGVSGAESCAFKNEGGEGDSSGHPRRIRCHIPLTAPSHVQAARSATWSEGCGASERNAVDLAAVPQVTRSRIQMTRSIARSEGCRASERSAIELAAALRVAVPRAGPNKARRLKRHAPAHGVPNQNGRHTCIARNGPAESQKRPRLEAQIEEARALRGAAASRTGARSMPRKLETEAPSPRICEQLRHIVPGRSLLREAVGEHDRDRRGATFPRVRRRSTPHLHAKAHALEIEATRLSRNLARHLAALLQNLVCHLRRPSLPQCGDSVDCAASLTYFSSMCVGFCERCPKMRKAENTAPL